MWLCDRRRPRPRLGSPRVALRGRSRAGPHPAGAARPELSRIATISDVHIGERQFGRWPRISPDGIWHGSDAYPTACSRAALDEALAWGAQLIVVKGDLTHDDRDAEYERLASLVASIPVPVLVLPGNHDGGDRRNGDGVSVLARHGVDLTTTVKVHDLPGVRVVAASSRGGAIIEATSHTCCPRSPRRCATRRAARCWRRTIRRSARLSPPSGRRASSASMAGGCFAAWRPRIRPRS